jgi:lactoylglutathione lyase
VTRPAAHGDHDELFAQLVIEVIVTDLPRSLAFYQALGFTLLRNAGDFASLRLDDRLIFLAAEPDHVRPARSSANLRVIVKDVEAAWRRALAAGATVVRPIADLGYGLRDFIVADPDGFELRFAQPVDGGSLG